MCLNFQAKGPLPDRTLESFIKSTDVAISGSLKGAKIARLPMECIIAIKLRREVSIINKSNA